MNYIQLAASLAIVIVLFYLHHRALRNVYAQGLDLGRQQGHITGLGEAERRNYQAGYHQGHEDGLAEGREKAELELRTREYKQEKGYEQGYQDAVQALLDETYRTMQDEVKAKSLSA